MFEKIRRLFDRRNIVEAEAFSNGAQGVTLDHSLAEVTANFERTGEDIKRRYVERIKGLEAAAELAKALYEEAKTRWEQMQEITGHRAPAFVMGALAVSVSLLVILGEGGLLSPVMSGFGLAEPAMQYLVASVMLIGFTLLLKWAVTAYHQSPRKLWQVIAPATFSIISLAAFGYFRATERMFAAKLNPAEPNFAADNWFATVSLMVLVTIALPVGAAVAIHWGLAKLRLWQEHRRARQDFLKYEKEATEKPKELETAIEERDHRLEEIAQQCAEWLAAMRDAHEQGRIIGVWKKPFGEVLFGICSVGLFIVVGTLLACYVLADGHLAQHIAGDAPRSALYLTLALALAACYAKWTISRWQRPSHEAVYRNHVTHFRNTSYPESLETNKTLPAPASASDNRGRPAAVANDNWAEELS